MVHEAKGINDYSGYFPLYTNEIKSSLDKLNLFVSMGSTDSHQFLRSENYYVNLAAAKTGYLDIETLDDKVKLSGTLNNGGWDVSVKKFNGPNNKALAYKVARRISTDNLIDSMNRDIQVAVWYLRKNGFVINDEISDDSVVSIRAFIDADGHLGVISALVIEMHQGQKLSGELKDFAPNIRLGLENGRILVHEVFNPEGHMSFSRRHIELLDPVDVFDEAWNQVR